MMLSIYSPWPAHYSGIRLNENRAGKDARAPSSTYPDYFSLLANECRCNLASGLGSLCSDGSTGRLVIIFFPCLMKIVVSQVLQKLPVE